MKLVQDTMEDDVIVLSQTRNFYGAHTIAHVWPEASGGLYELRSGGVNHGLQMRAPDKRGWPTMYYSERSGLGLAMTLHPRQANRRIGVVGLGVGTAATYANATDYIRFYEIDPEMVRLASQYFTYLTDSRARIDVVLGDARLQLEREAEQKFDVLVLDAFTGGTIPVHLLTVEAFETYRRHLKPDGAMVVHISNRHLDLRPVVRGAAEAIGLQAVFVRSEWSLDNPASSSMPRLNWQAEWMVLSANQTFMSTRLIRRADSLYNASKRVSAWTDEKHHVFGALGIGS